SRLRALRRPEWPDAVRTSFSRTSRGVTPLKPFSWRERVDAPGSTTRGGVDRIRGYRARSWPDPHARAFPEPSGGRRRLRADGLRTNAARGVDARARPRAPLRRRAGAG